MSSIDKKTFINPTTNPINPTTNSINTNSPPKLMHSITEPFNNLPGTQFKRSRSTIAYRSFTGEGDKPKISGSDMSEIILSEWDDITYQELDLKVGDVRLNARDQTLSFGSIGTQLVSSYQYNDSLENKEMTTINVQQWPADRIPTNGDSSLDAYINSYHNTEKYFFDFFAIFEIGNNRIPITYCNTTASYKEIHLGSHSGDITETKIIRVNVMNLDGSTSIKYVEIKKLRHTIILNIPNLVEISKTEPVAVYLYNAGYNGGREHMLYNYMSQETVCDIYTVDEDNNKKKYLFESPLYTEDSITHSAALVSLISVNSEEVKINILQKFAQGIATDPTKLYNRIKNKFWAELTELEPSLKAFDTKPTPTTHVEEADDDLDELPGVLPPPMAGLQRSNAQPLRRSIAQPIMRSMAGQQ
jgi:hypothetical protein